MDAKVLAIVDTSCASTSGDRVGAGAGVGRVYSHHVRHYFWKWLSFEARHTVSDGKYDNVFFLYEKKTRLKSCVGLFVSQERDKQHSSRCEKSKKKKKKKQALFAGDPVFFFFFSLWTNSPRSAASDLQRVTEPRRTFVR